MEKSLHIKSSPGKRTRNKTVEKKDSSAYKKLYAIRLYVSLVLFAFLCSLRYGFPAAEGFHSFMSAQLNEGWDYRATFSAIGDSVRNGSGIIKAFLEVAEEEPTDITTEVEPAGRTSDKKIISAEGVSELSKMNQETEADSADEPRHVLAAEGEETDTYMDELKLKLYGEELEEGEYDESLPPETASYDYLVLEFNYSPPIQGRITADYGYRNNPISGAFSFHYGIDIGAPTGTEIHSFASGTVEEVGWSTIYGNYIFVRHKDGIISFYGHCSKIIAIVGQLVTSATVLGYVGNTGYSTGPHLHFEVRNGNITLNPAYYLDQLCVK